MFALFDVSMGATRRFIRKISGQVTTTGMALLMVGYQR
jgi:hypothetical protein